ncbi:hypothetical protein OBV_07010 [Oscillibacter valericigenes Sjm18-20]|nr:hypothetical protein OBV_07010 [Oscillibacter valericigenes Sjm18-20]
MRTQLLKNASQRTASRRVSVRWALFLIQLKFVRNSEAQGPERHKEGIKLVNFRIEFPFFLRYVSNMIDQ